MTQNKQTAKAQNFTQFFKQTHISAALIVFALLALLFATLEFSSALLGK